MEGASLEKAEEMKQNGLEGNLGEVMRASEMGTELGTGVAAASPCAQGRGPGAKVQLYPPTHPGQLLGHTMISETPNPFCSGSLLGEVSVPLPLRSPRDDSSLWLSCSD